MQNKILVTGGSSIVAKHLRKHLPDAIYIGNSHQSDIQCDLTNKGETIQLFGNYKPEIVIHLAARVGGIFDNINYPVDYLEENILINTHSLKYAHQFGCKKFLAILSSCIYPDILPEHRYPIFEEDLHKGAPTPTNFEYAIAKRCLAVQVGAYNKQYKTNYNCLNPCNLYSEYDNHQGDKAHFVTALLSKIAEAKINNQDSIELFGSGKPLRQFMYAEDLANVINFFINNDYKGDYNVATSEVLSIKQIAEVALEATETKNLTIKWDKNKPDGQFRKDISTRKLENLIPSFKYTRLIDGLKKVFDVYYAKMAAKC